MSRSDTIISYSTIVTTTNASMASVSETIPGTYNPVQSSSSLAVAKDTHPAVADDDTEDMTERTVTSTRVVDDSTEGSHVDETYLIVREVPCVMSSSSSSSSSLSKEVPRQQDYKEEKKEDEGDDDDHDHDIIIDDGMIHITVDSPVRPTTARTQTSSPPSPDGARSLSPRDEYYYANDTFHFPPGVGRTEMMDDSLRRLLYRIVQEQLDLSFRRTTDANNGGIDVIYPPGLPNTGTSTVVVERGDRFVHEKDTIDTGEDPFPTVDETRDTYESVGEEGEGKKKFIKDKQKKIKKSKKNKKLSRTKHFSTKQKEDQVVATAITVFNLTDTPTTSNDNNNKNNNNKFIIGSSSSRSSSILEDAQDDGLGITSRLDDTMHHRRMDPPGVRQYAPYELEERHIQTEATGDSLNQKQRSKKVSEKRATKCKSSSSSSSTFTKRKSNSGPSSPPTSPTERSTSSVSSIPSEWQLAKERFHRVASSPSRPFVPPKRREIRSKNGFPGGLDEARRRGRRKIKIRIPPPPLLAKDNNDDRMMINNGTLVA